MDQKTIDIINNNIFIINESTTLYHSRVDHLILNKYLWTSIDYEQSLYHIYDSNCRRYIQYLYQNKIMWPRLYTLHPKLPIKLLNLEIRNVKGKNIHYLKNGDIKLYDIMSQVGIIPQKNNCSDESFENDCNSKILDFLYRLNQRYNTNIIGYYCDNDQHEIAIYDSTYLKIKDNTLLSKIYITDSDSTKHFCIPLLIFSEYIDFIKKFFKKYIFDTNNRLREEDQLNHDDLIEVNKNIMNKHDLIGNVNNDIHSIIDKIFTKYRSLNTILLNESLDDLDDLDSSKTSIITSKFTILHEYYNIEIITQELLKTKYFVSLNYNDINNLTSDKLKKITKDKHILTLIESNLDVIKTYVFMYMICNYNIVSYIDNMMKKINNNIYIEYS